MQKPISRSAPVRPIERSFNYATILKNHAQGKARSILTHYYSPKKETTLPGRPIKEDIIKYESLTLRFSMFGVDTDPSLGYIV